MPDQDIEYETLPDGRVVLKRKEAPTPESVSIPREGQIIQKSLSERLFPTFAGKPLARGLRDFMQPSQNPEVMNLPELAKIVDSVGAQTLTGGPTGAAVGFAGAAISPQTAMTQGASGALANLAPGGPFAKLFTRPAAAAIGAGVVTGSPSDMLAEGAGTGLGGLFGLSRAARNVKNALPTASEVAEDAVHAMKSVKQAFQRALDASSDLKSGYGLTNAEEIAAKALVKTQNPTSFMRTIVGPKANLTPKDSVAFAAVEKMLSPEEISSVTDYIGNTLAKRAAESKGTSLFGYIGGGGGKIGHFWVGVPTSIPIPGSKLLPILRNNTTRDLLFKTMDGDVKAASQLGGILAVPELSQTGSGRSILQNFMGY